MNSRTNIASIESESCRERWYPLLLRNDGNQNDKYHTTQRLAEDYHLVMFALNPKFRTTLLSGICIPKMVLRRNADEKKKKDIFGQV